MPVPGAGMGFFVLCPKCLLLYDPADRTTIDAGGIYTPGNWTINRSSVKQPGCGVLSDRQSPSASGTMTAVMHRRQPELLDLVKTAAR